MNSCRVKPWNAFWVSTCRVTDRDRKGMWVNSWLLVKLCDHRDSKRATQLTRSADKGFAIWLAQAAACAIRRKKNPENLHPYSWHNFWNTTLPCLPLYCKSYMSINIHTLSQSSHTSDMCVYECMRTVLLHKRTQWTEMPRDSLGPVFWSGKRILLKMTQSRGMRPWATPTVFAHIIMLVKTHQRAKLLKIIYITVAQRGNVVLYVIHFSRACYVWKLPGVWLTWCDFLVSVFELLQLNQCDNDK